MSAFQAAVDAQFVDPNLSVDAHYRAGGDGVAIPVRVQWASPEAIAERFDVKIDLDAMTIRVRLSEIREPKEGDTFEFGDELVEEKAIPKLVTVNALGKIDDQRLCRWLQVGPADG